MQKITDLMEDSIAKLNEIRRSLEMHSNNSMAINLIIDDKDPQNPVFIEIETDDGKSISIGENSQDENGYRNVRITITDIMLHELI